MFIDLVVFFIASNSFCVKLAKISDDYYYCCFLYTSHIWTPPSPSSDDV